jgi:hypothetical protein
MKPAILTALILFFIQMNLPACTAEDREIFTFLSDVQKKLQMKLTQESGVLRRHQVCAGGKDDIPVPSHQSLFQTAPSVVR